MHSFLVVCGLLPLRHNSAARRTINESLHLIQAITLPYFSLVLMAIRSAMCLLNFYISLCKSAIEVFYMIPVRVGGNAN